MHLVEVKLSHWTLGKDRNLGTVHSTNTISTGIVSRGFNKLNHGACGFDFAKAFTGCMWKCSTREFNGLQNVLTRALTFGQDFGVVRAKLNSPLSGVVDHLERRNDVVQLNESGIGRPLFNRKLQEGWLNVDKLRKRI